MCLVSDMSGGRPLADPHTEEDEMTAETPEALLLQNGGSLSHGEAVRRDISAVSVIPATGEVRGCGSISGRPRVVPCSAAGGLQRTYSATCNKASPMAVAAPPGMSNIHLLSTDCDRDQYWG